MVSNPSVECQVAGHGSRVQRSNSRRCEIPPHDRSAKPLQSEDVSLERERRVVPRSPMSNDGSDTARLSRWKSSVDFARYPSVIGKLLHRKVAASIGSLQVCREDRDADAGNRCRDVSQDGTLRAPRTRVAGRHAVRVDTFPVSAPERCPQIRRSTPAGGGKSGEEDAQGRSPTLRESTIAGSRAGGADDAGSRIAFGQRIQCARSSIANLLQATKPASAKPFQDKRRSRTRDTMVWEIRDGIA